MEPAIVPAPAALLHLRPTDLKGAAVVTVAAATTTLGAWTSLSDAWTWWLGGQVLLAASLVQWFAILHECGHDTLFRTRRLHPVIGTVAGLLTLIPYRCWTRVHGRHHR
jgi:omega-6 fatty acid desaturase (delta-12 desaturase)